MSNLEFEQTPRGFAIAGFKDRYGADCSIQESSLAEEAAIWLGVDNSDPRIMASQAAEYGLHTDKTSGWIPYPIPKDVLLTTRMHLTQDMVASLLPALQSFAATGELNGDLQQANQDILTDALRYRYLLEHRMVSLDTMLHGNGCAAHTPEEISAELDRRSYSKK